MRPSRAPRPTLERIVTRPSPIASSTTYAADSALTLWTTDRLGAYRFADRHDAAEAIARACGNDPALIGRYHIVLPTVEQEAAAFVHPSFREACL